MGWARAAFIQAQGMVEDRYLYDPVTRRYTVDRYLDDLKARFGGIDAVLIWPTYPNMGVDDRDQIDLLTAMPGGIEGVKGMVADFHRRGVRVLFPFMMWDQGTRDPGAPWPQALARLMAELGADGMNGDTQDGVPLSFSLAADAMGRPLAFQPEGLPSDEALAWNLMSWGQYAFEFAPKVDRFRWLEPLHMVNISDRWSRSKTDDLQYAFFNGEGWESWENIWGIVERDHPARRRGDPQGICARTRCGAVALQRGLGTVLPYVAVWRIRQPLAEREPRFGPWSIATNMMSTDSK